MAKKTVRRKAKSQGTTTPLELSTIRIAVANSIQLADDAVVLGKKKVDDAIKSGDADRIRRNKAALAIAEKAQNKLPKVFQALNDACCNQVFNCDPQFD